MSLQLRMRLAGLVPADELPPPAPRRRSDPSLSPSSSPPQPRPTPAAARGFVTARFLWERERASARPSLNVLAGAGRGLLLPDPAQLADAMGAMGHTGSMVFIDTEATGLAGAGAFAFLIGAARVLDAGIEVRQWRLEQPGAEAAMLSDFFGWLQETTDSLASYNGASFDLPLLLRRARRFGLKGEALTDPPHLDLLHVCRRLWRDAVTDCRLSTLERQRLFLRREGDIEGGEIPEVFWRWLQAPSPGASARLDRVCEHNHVDVLTLPLLLVRACGALEGPRGLAEQFGAARQRLAMGDEDGACRALAEAVVATLSARPRADPLLLDAGLLAGRLLRRAGEHGRAAVVWRGLCRVFPGDPSAHEALAKHLEHRERNLPEALAVAVASRIPCAHRIARLERRMGRAHAV